MSQPLITRVPPRLPDLPQPPPPPPEPRHATRAQRMALLAGLALACVFALQLFASILLPFVAAAGIAYFLDPLASRLHRAGMGRSVAALLLVVGLVAAGLLCLDALGTAFGGEAQMPREELLGTVLPSALVEHELLRE